jgi:hypothetical protein
MSEQTNALYVIIGLVIVFGGIIGLALLFKDRAGFTNYTKESRPMPAEGFESAPTAGPMAGPMADMAAMMAESEKKRESAPVMSAESFANPSEPSNVPFAAGNAPSNCYPKNQLNATELLPADPNSKWAQVNPQGAGDIAGKNYLNAGALIGVNTVGQSLRNASHDLRSEPANPQVAVSPWFNSTIEPDINRRVLEIQ